MNTMNNFRILNHHHLERVFRLRHLLRLRRRRLTMPRCYLLTSKFLLPSLIALYVYLLVMDVKLYSAVKSHRGGDLSNKTSGGVKGIFWPLPVKKIMIGEATHFVRSPLAEMIESSLHFSDTFPFITANVVSFTHFLLSLVCVRFLGSETLRWRQYGVVLFQVRNFLDSFDGVIYRAHAKQRANYKSHYGSFGYYVDALSDVLGGICLVVSIGLFLLKKRPPNISGTRCFRLKSEYEDEVDDYDDDNDYNDEQEEEVVTKVMVYKDLPNDSYTLLSNKEHQQDQPVTKQQHQMLASSASSSFVNKSESVNSSRMASKTTICVSLLLVGARLALSAMFWDRSVHAYEDLLDSTTTTAQTLSPLIQSKYHHTLQARVLESNLTLFIMMSWRVMSAIGLMDILLTAIFIDKIWEFIVKTQLISWIALIGLIVLTELHLSEIRSIMFRVE